MRNGLTLKMLNSNDHIQYTDLVLKKINKFTYGKAVCRIEFLVLKLYKYVIEYIISIKFLFLNGNIEVVKILAIDPIYGLLFNTSNYVDSFIYGMNLYT